MVRDVAAALDFLHTKGEPGLGLSGWVGLVASEGQGRGAGQVEGWELVQLAGTPRTLRGQARVAPTLLRGMAGGCGAITWNRAWGRDSPRATGEGGQRPWSAAGAGRTRAAQGGCRLLAGVGEGFPVVLSSCEELTHWKRL